MSSSGKAIISILHRSNGGGTPGVIWTGNLKTASTYASGHVNIVRGVMGCGITAVAGGLFQTGGALTVPNSLV